MSRLTPCICVETGVEFESCTELAAYLGVSRQTVNCLLSTGQSRYGFHYRRKDEDNPPPLKKGRSWAKGMSKAHVNGVKVKCVETSETFESISAAARQIGCTKQNVHEAMKNGTTAKGFHFIAGEEE